MQRALGMLYLLLIALIAGVGAGLPMCSAQEIAVVDFDKALKSHPMWTRAMVQLEKNQTERLKNLQQWQDLIEKQEKSLADKKTASPEEEIIKMKEEFTKAYEMGQRALAEEQKKASLELYLDLQKQIQRYADNNNIALVLNKRPLAKEGSEGIEIDPVAVVIANHKTVDITDEIISALKRREASEALLKPSTMSTTSTATEK